LKGTARSSARDFLNNIRVPRGSLRGLAGHRRQQVTLLLFYFYIPPCIYIYIVKGWPDSCKIIYGTRGDNNNKKMRSVKNPEILLLHYMHVNYIRVTLEAYVWAVIIGS